MEDVYQSSYLRIYGHKNPDPHSNFLGDDLIVNTGDMSPTTQHLVTPMGSQLVKARFCSGSSVYYPLRAKLHLFQTTNEYARKWIIRAKEHKFLSDCFTTWSY